MKRVLILSLALCGVCLSCETITQDTEDVSTPGIVLKKSPEAFFYTPFPPSTGLPAEIFELCVDVVPSGNHICRDDFQTLDAACNWMAICNAEYPDAYVNWTINGLNAVALCSI